jgi:hypothetical protein
MSSKLIFNRMKRGRNMLLRSPSPLRVVKEKGRLSHLQENRQNHPLPKEKEPKVNYSLVKRVSRPRILLKEISL